MRQKVALALTLLLSTLLGSIAPALAASPAPPTLFGHFGGGVGAVAAAGDYAYAGVGNSLEVLSLANPAAPSRVGALPLPRLVDDIALSGGYAYVLGASRLGDNTQQIFVVDLASPTQPRLVTTLGPLAGASGALTVAGRYLYAASGKVYTFDLQSPASPQQLASFGSYAALNDIAAAAGYLYLAAGSDGVRVISVANPAAPVEVGFFKSTIADEIVIRVAVGGGRVYSASSSQSAFYLRGIVRALDVSDPAAPQRINSFSQSGYTATIAYADGRVYVGSAAGDINPFPQLGVYAADLLAQLGTADLAEPPHALAPIAGGILVAQGDLRSLAVDGAGRPSTRGAYAPPSFATGLSRSGDALLLEQPDGAKVGLTPLDIAQPAAPRQLGQTQSIVGGHSLLSGEIIYTPKDTGGLAISRLLASGAITPTGQISTTGTVTALAVSGSTVYLADSAEGLVSVNAASPSAPQRLGALALAGSYSDILLAGARAYLVPTCTSGDSAHLQIIDLSSPQQPVAAKPLGIACGAAVAAVAGTTLYLAQATCITFSCTSSLRVVDLANPQAPIERSTLQLGAGRATAIVFAAGHLVISFSQSARFDLRSSGPLRLVNIADPTAPALAGEYVLPTSAVDIAVSGPLIAVASEEGGLNLLWARQLFMPSNFSYLPVVTR